MRAARAALLSSFVQAMTGDDATVGRNLAVQPNKVPAIEGHDRSSLADREGQNVGIGDPLLGLPSLLGSQHIMT
jgi:hypothetical protein